MLRSSKELHGYPIEALDGQIGHLDQFYFNGKNWGIRYMVINVGNWLNRKQVLISPQSFESPTPAVLPAKLFKEQIEKSPDIDTDKPVSRARELELHSYYGWVNFWDTSHYIGPAPMPVEPMVVREQQQNEEEKARSEPDNNLRSSREVVGYHIHAADREIGHVDDFIVDTEQWALRYLVIDTRNWLPGRKVLVATDWVDDITWSESMIYSSLTSASIQSAPEFNPDELVNREYEEIIYDYYGRPRYWIR
ncbi:MAG: PRC-barrel domain containing protein [Chitinivibrionales bacterium]|nr:PRC-barrel domain containing protein [Chitinivibrionales bacterium]